MPRFIFLAQPQNRSLVLIYRYGGEDKIGGWGQVPTTVQSVWRIRCFLGQPPPTGRHCGAWLEDKPPKSPRWGKGTGGSGPSFLGLSSSRKSHFHGPRDFPGVSAF